MDDVIKLMEYNLEIAKNDIIQRMQENGKYVTGKTASEITISDGNISFPKWMNTLQYGRGPGAGVPIDALTKWAASKGISFDSKADMDRWIYFTIKKIKELGTEQYRKGQYIDIFDTPLYEASTRITDDISNQISINY